MLNIAIVGAGPAGCMLARLLANAQVSITIFESENTPNFRDQGGTLDLHDDSGLLALKNAGLHDTFLNKARVDGDAMRVCDKYMHTWLRLPSSEDSKWFAQGKPEIDRSDLRQILADSLPPDMIRWGRRVQAVDSTAGTLAFEDGSIESDFDLVVGAEGAWSKTRSALTHIKPFYSGVAGFTASVLDPQKSIPEVYKLVNRGSWFTYSDKSLVLGQQMHDDSLYVTVWATMPREWQAQAGYDVHDGVAVRAALLDRFHDWSAPTRQLIAAIDPASLVPRSAYMLPVDFTWPHTRRATLIGDAAHLMTPFIGEGVNTAMRDALELANAITSAGKDRDLLDLHVAEYERSMYARAHVVQLRTRDMMELMLFTRGAPGSTIERWILRSMSDDLSPALLALCKVVVYPLYALWRCFITSYDCISVVGESEKRPKSS